MLSDEKITEYIKLWKKKGDIRMYSPIRYFKGLKRKRDVVQRLETMRKSIKHTKNGIRQFETDKLVKTKPSSWTQKFHKAYPGVGGSKIKISKATGIPVWVLKEVFKRGEKAYSTGHRPGANPYQWAYARMYSFIMRHNKSSLTHDKDLVIKWKASSTP